MLSNFLEVSKSCSLKKAKSENLNNKRFNYFNFNFSNWYLTRFSWPRAIFVSSAFNSSLAIHEAYC
jgi:hypothetical protein